MTAKFANHYIKVFHNLSQKGTEDVDFMIRAMKDLYNIRQKGNVSNNVIEKWANHWCVIGSQRYTFEDNKAFMNNIKKGFFT